MSLGGEIMEEFYETHIIPKYKDLLEQCLGVLNFIPNQKIEGKDTYTLAAEIGKLLKENQ